MTYQQSEDSAYDGKPIELYTFFRGTAVWRYTSAEDDQTIDGFLYQARPLNRAAVEQTPETIRNALSVKCAASIPVVDAFRNGVPSSVTTMELRRFHAGVAEYLTIWRGRIVNVKFGEREAEIRCESIFTSILRPVLRRFYQTNCPHVLYGPQCRADRATYKVTATLAGVAGNVITSSAFALKPDGYYAGGYVDWTEGSELQRRFVMTHVASALTLSTPFVSIPGNANIAVYPGCDHSLPTCNVKFANEDNYGGQPFFPGKNPFGGAPIF